MYWKQGISFIHTVPSNWCPSGIRVVPIPVISIERNRDPTCKKNRYVVLTRNTVSEESVHLKNHENYQKEVYKSCMDYVCKVMHGFDNDEKVEVSNEFQWVGWNDGDIMMLADIVK